MKPKNKYKVAQRGSTFEEVLHLNTVVFCQKSVTSEYGRKFFFAIKNVYISLRNKNISNLISTDFVFLTISSYCRNILKISSTVKINQCQIYKRC